MLFNFKKVDSPFCDFCEKELETIEHLFFHCTKVCTFWDDLKVLQSLLTAYNNMAKRMGLSINIKKTETMSIGPEEQFFIDGMPIKTVNRFKYLGSIVTSDCSVNAELIAPIKAVSCAYGRLRERVFDSHDLTLSTKLKVYFQCLTPLLTYGCETWTLHRHHINQLRTVQQRHLRKILLIKCSERLKPNV